MLLILSLMLHEGSAAAESPDVKSAEAGPLKSYVAKADDSYGWVKRREGKFAGADYAELTLTSQTWKGITWKHQLYILKPAEVDDLVAFVKSLPYETPPEQTPNTVLGGCEQREAVAPSVAERKLVDGLAVDIDDDTIGGESVSLWHRRGRGELSTSP